ncbi:hypothetical protein ASPCAL11253 [Aspergillus calidoustus]|uniref:Uncharacterized protein n=1 Tax=Aspergillus calidoustus TaxID=454130 RepID=A0A0U5H2N6_ASPCI|nr:hypothetical protein ASPCAL11253 [Aspergillus calidoustus]
MSPLVWFLANRGDEWRVYGCVPGRARVRIIGLWDGCILRHDSSLQLLLIIDLICDWPRDIFTEQVMSSLRRRAGPNYSMIASTSTFDEVVLLEPGLARNPSRSRSNTPRRGMPEDAQEEGARSEVDIKNEASRALDEARCLESGLARDTSRSRSITPRLDLPKDAQGARARSEVEIKIGAESGHKASSEIESERAVGRESTVTTMDGTDTHDQVHPRKRSTPTAIPEEPYDNSFEPIPSIETAKTTEVGSTNAATVEGTDTRTDTMTGEASIPTVSAAHSPKPSQAAMNDNCDDRDLWAQYVVRTGKEDVKLLFRHVSLPEVAYGLNDMLRAMGPADTGETA